MKEALLIVNFGTSVPSARESIRAVEKKLVQTMPGADVYSCITSSIIRRILTKRGEEVYSLEQALEKLAPMAYDRVVVQPTHFLYGVEYDRIKAAVSEYAQHFRCLILGKPLLADAEDLIVLAKCLKERYQDPEEALVLMGHGTAHPANMVYPAFQTVLRMEGYSNAYVGTVEGWPAIEDVIVQLKADRQSRVLLVPMMLVAGDHACNDMAGDEPDSWKNKLEAEGFSARCHMEGMGNLPEIQAVYCGHLRTVISESI